MSNLENSTNSINSEIEIDLKTGKGTASIRGTAKLAGVDNESVRRPLKTAADLQPAKLAVFLMQQGFTAADLLSWSTKGIPDIGVAAILEYFSFEAGRYCTEQAKLTFRVMARIGVRAWMQELKGYKKPETSEVTEDNFNSVLVKQLPFAPKKWQCRFKPEFWTALESLYGLTREKKACARFISHWVYQRFPKVVVNRINEINPNDNNFNRKNKIHQHFDGVLLEALEQLISEVTCNLIKAKNKHHFKRLMKSASRYEFLVTELKQIEGVIDNE